MPAWPALPTGVAALVALTCGAYSAPRFVCDMTNPSPATLCADHYAGYPRLIQECIQEEVDSINFINENQSKIDDSILEDCGAAGCKAGYSKLKTTAACIRSLLSLKPPKNN